MFDLFSLAGAAALATIALAEERAGEVDPKMQREVDMAKERLGRAIDNRDVAALADISPIIFPLRWETDKRRRPNGA